MKGKIKHITIALGICLLLAMIVLGLKNRNTIYTWLNSSYKCNGIHINNLFKFFVWCEVSKSFTRSII